jgi:hypothetical protein
MSDKLRKEKMSQLYKGAMKRHKKDAKLLVKELKKWNITKIKN